VGFRNCVFGLLPALSVLEVRFAGEFPADADPFLGRDDYDGGELQFLLLDQKGPQAVMVSTSVKTICRVANAPARIASRLAGSRPSLD
jgi:hypothetical protein